MAIVDADLTPFMVYAARELQLDADERAYARFGLAFPSRFYAMCRTRNLLRLYTATWRPHRPSRIRMTIAPALPTNASRAPTIVVVRIEHAVLVATYTITAN
jgi:hypothetical protein